jgi:hypothetical protein
MNNPLIFGGPEANEVLTVDRQLGAEAIPVRPPRFQAVAERIVRLVIDTYSDNLSENADGAIVVETSWWNDMREGIATILKEAAANDELAEGG